MLKRQVDLIKNLNFFQNAAFSLNGMHLKIPQTECWTFCRAESSSGTARVGNQARSLAPWAILSISGYEDTTSPHQTF